ncbi:MAG: amidase [Pseudomonadota bacterium]
MRKKTENARDNASVSRRDFVAGALATTALTGVGWRSASAATFTSDELIYMPASLQLNLFRSRQLSPVEVLKAQIARHEAVNSKVNCTTYTHFDKAMKEAKESEQRWMNGTARPLEGITCALKDEHHEEGMIVTSGSVIDKDNRKDTTDELTAKLKAAGAIPHIQTTAPEFYVHGLTFSKLWGVTRNPWNLAYGVGGSSGGSGAALSGGMTTIATGSDMGGSIRLPCAFNGCYGFKPPTGRISTELPLAPFAGSGPMARAFDDMAMMQNVMSGQTPHAPATLPRLEMPLSYPGIEGMRIAYSPDLNFVKISSETRKNVDAAAQRLRDLGANVEEVQLDMGITVDEMSDMFSKTLLSGPMGGWLETNYLDRIDDMTPYAAWFVGKLKKGEYRGPQAAEFEAWMKTLYARLADQLWNAGYDGLVTATLNDSHTPADHDHSLQGFEIEGEKLPKLFISSLTMPWNILNWHPVVEVPAGLTSKNMPVGMQIVAKPYADLTAFQIAYAYAGATEPLFMGNRMPDLRTG